MSGWKLGAKIRCSNWGVNHSWRLYDGFWGVFNIPSDIFFEHFGLCEIVNSRHAHSTRI